jgi:hypothetical protein
MPAGIVPRRRHEPYQYYLKASLLVAITIGWLLGAIELTAITFHSAFQSLASRLISPALFQVHGQSQIIGWVGLFIMGISYQVIPRQRRVAIHTPVLAYVVLTLMLSGIALRAISQPLAAGSRLFGGLTVLSALLELAGVGLFMGGIIKGRVMADSIQGPERFSRAALQWFSVALLLNLGTTVYLAVHGSSVVPDWLDRALIIVELFGFVMSMIFGHAPVIVPAVLGVRLPFRRWFYAHVLLLHAALLLRIVGDASGNTVAWQIGGAGTEVAIVVFLAASATAVIHGRHRVRSTR